METLERPETASISTEREFTLLRERDRAEDWRHWRIDASVSAGLHVILVAVLFLMPESTAPPPPPERVFMRVTPIFVPSDLTQKAPNKGKIAKEITVETIAPRPAIKAPSPAPAAPKPAQQQAKSFVPPPPQPAPEQAKPVIVEPPKVEANAPATTAQISQLAPTPPPAPVEQPKLTLQDVAPPPGTRSAGTGRPTGLLQVPNASIQEAIRNLARGPQGTQSVGDLGGEEAGSGAGLNLPPSAGRPRSNLELKSDAMGVDFRPYLIQVLAAVRRNWFAVYPEAARLGQKGQVQLQFAIVKQGTVAKVVFTGESGTKALDQAAVAAISASNPLPPLPPEFRGERVVLQMTFQYNMPR